jgi:predicted RNase H-like nuclease (RuvC/YqgF family)
VKYFDEEDAITEYEKQLQKKDNEIERLKEDYMILQNASDEVEEEKDREIERLNNIINELGKWLDKKDNEIERLNNNINKGIEAINVYQNEKTLSVGYEDLKRIRGILRGNEFDLKMFAEYLQELKGVDKE